MGRASIRQAAFNYFTNAGIPNVGTVFASRPIVVTEDDYDIQMAEGLIKYVTSPQGSSGVIIVNISESARKRDALTGYGGAVADFTIHQMELELFFANSAGNAEACQTDHDATVDAIVIAIRADPTLGTAGNPGAIFGAGVFSVPVTVHQGSPFWGPDGTTVFIPSIVRFEAWESVVGTGV
jgi:hypothetical protein